MHNKKKIKILFSGLSGLARNYGAQAIAFPLMERLDRYFEGNYTFTIPDRLYEKELDFAAKNNFHLVAEPDLPIMSSGGVKYAFINLIYNIASVLKKRGFLLPKDKERYSVLSRAIKDHDIIIDLSGIEFIGNLSFPYKWWSCFSVFYMQLLCGKCGKPYLKFTKSYGPFKGFLYKLLVKKSLNACHLIFARGKESLEALRELKLNVPCYNVPGVSIALEPVSQDWARVFLKNLGVDINRPIVGLSPSSVIAHKMSNEYICGGAKHVLLVKEVINFFQKNDRQIVIIPHSLEYDEGSGDCDLILSQKIYNDLLEKSNVFLIADKNLIYAQVRAIIGCLDFYVTGRFHSVVSALCAGVPVVPFAWHAKYRDIMSLFLNDFPLLDYKILGQKESLSLIRNFYDNRAWFDKEKVLRKREECVFEIDKYMDMFCNKIKELI